jgi:hypothetical protein
VSVCETYLLSFIPFEAQDPSSLYGQMLYCPTPMSYIVTRSVTKISSIYLYYFPEHNQITQDGHLYPSPSETVYELTLTMHDIIL